MAFYIGLEIKYFVSPNYKMEDLLIYEIDEHDIEYDMHKLMTTDGMLAGLTTIKHYMFNHICNVKVYSKGTFQQKYVSFYDVHLDIDRLIREYPYINKAINNASERRPKRPFKYHVYEMFRLYYGTVSVFKPSIAKRLVETFKPSCVLDPCAGWGSRMLGCIAGGADTYIGFDTNMNLELVYQQMIAELGFERKARIIMDDCAKVNYEDYNYDMIITSPPYYNTEVYPFSTIMSKEQWNEWYLFVIEKWWRGLHVGGVMALALPFSVYHLAVHVSGDCDDCWRLNNVKRCVDKMDTELLS